MCDDNESWIQATDGGYIEGSGGEVMLRLWDAFQPLVDDFNEQDHGFCVVPIAVMLQNEFVGPTEYPARDLLNEGTLVPLAAATSYLNGTAEWTQQVLSAFGDNGHLISPSVQPGMSPSLGWALAPMSQQRMLEETNGLGRSDGTSAERIEALKTVLSGDGLVCPSSASTAAVRMSSRRSQ